MWYAPGGSVPHKPYHQTPHSYHFPIDGGRYIVFLFEATQYEGELCSSDEGRMHWIKIEELDKINLVDDFHDLIDVMLHEDLSEFQYVIENKKWNIIKK